MKNLVFFDSVHRSELLPLTYTRPMADIRIGGLTIAEKWGARLQGNHSYITQEYLQPRYPVTLTQDNWFINGGVIPNVELATQVTQLALGQGLRDEHGAIAYRALQYKSESIPPRYFMARP